jgi:hypothetical protein
MGKSKCKSKKRGRKRRKRRVTKKKKGGNRLYSDLVRDLSVIAPLYGDYLYGTFRKQHTPIDFTTENGKQVKWNWIFTRHGSSCNNISSIFNKVQEPRLTDGGITRLLKHKKGKEKYYKSNAVFVSPLIRTWMTAIILYCNGYYKPNVLTLYVAPFLKEHTKMGGVVKRGNYPVNIFEQLKSLFTFLVYLKNKLDSYKMVEYIDLMFPIHDEKKFEQSRIHISTNTIQFQSKETILYENLTENHMPQPLKDYYKLEEQGEETMEWYNPYNYKSNGKIEKFMKWIITHRDMFGYKSDNNDITVHTVTHSNVMKTALDNMKRSDCHYHKKQNKSIFDTNAWSLHIPESDVRKIYMEKGIPKKERNDPSWKKSTMCST